MVDTSAAIYEYLQNQPAVDKEVSGKRESMSRSEEKAKRSRSRSRGSEQRSEAEAQAEKEKLRRRRKRNRKNYAIKKCIIQVPCGTFLRYFWPHSRIERQILKNTLVKHMVFKRKTEPEFRMGPSRKRIQKQRVFLQPGAPKLTSKWSPKSMKTVPCRIFLLPKKQQNSRSIFFSMFLLSGRPGP